MDEILTTEELSEVIKLSTQTVLNMTREGKIPGVPMGNRWLFVKDQVLDCFREIAKLEQIKRQEVSASKPIEPIKLGEKRKPGRPSKKIDLSKYQES